MSQTRPSSRVSRWNLISGQRSGIARFQPRGQSYAHDKPDSFRDIRAGAFRKLYFHCPAGQPEELTRFFGRSSSNGNHQSRGQLIRKRETLARRYGLSGLVFKSRPAAFGGKTSQRSQAARAYLDFTDAGRPDHLMAIPAIPHSTRCTFQREGGTGNSSSLGAFSCPAQRSPSVHTYRWPVRTAPRHTSSGTIGGQHVERRGPGTRSYPGGWLGGNRAQLGQQCSLNWPARVSCLL